MDPSQLSTLLYLLGQNGGGGLSTQASLVGQGSAPTSSVAHPQAFPLMTGSSQQRGVNPNPFVPQNTSDPFVPQFASQSSSMGSY